MMKLFYEKIYIWVLGIIAKIYSKELTLTV